MRFALASSRVRHLTFHSFHAFHTFHTFTLSSFHLFTFHLFRLPTLSSFALHILTTRFECLSYWPLRALAISPFHPVICHPSPFQAFTLFTCHLRERSLPLFVLVIHPFNSFTFHSCHLSLSFPLKQVLNAFRTGP